MLKKKFSLKKIKFIIKLKITSDIKSLNAKVSTVLGQRRINSSEFLNFLKHQMEKLKISKNTNLELYIWLIVFELDDYLVYLKMPVFSNLINRVLYLDKNSKTSGYIISTNKLNNNYNYTITPYILYELVNYKYKYENIDNLFFISNYKKYLHSLKSKGIHIYKC